MNGRPRTAALVLALLVGACAPTDDATDGQRSGPTPEEIAGGLLPAVQLEGEPVLTYTLEQRMAYYNVPGISVAVMDGGEVAWARGWGVADAGTGAPVGPTTLFQAASISKPVAALAALSLVEEGRLTLDGPINDVLDSWKVADNEFTADSAVTLRGLLTHSAGTTVWGFPGYRKDEPFSDDHDVATNAEVLDGEGNTDEVRVYKVPGTSWQYSGGGYTVMEQAVEDVTGQPFPEVVRARVLEPAGMRLSTYEAPLPVARWAEAARGHRGDGSEVEGEWHTYPEQAAAGLWTTPTELLTLSAHLLNVLEGEEGGVLSRAMLQAMLTPHHEGDEAFANWGLGFGLSGEGDGARFGHGGSNEGFKSQWTVLRNRGQGVAIMTNGDAGSALAVEVMRAVAAAYDWPAPDLEPEVRAFRSIDASALAAYEGTYSRGDRPDFLITIQLGGDDLVVSVPGQGSFPLTPSVEDDAFFDRNDGSTIRFVRSDDGQVAAVENEAGVRYERR